MSVLHETSRNMDEPGGNFALQRTLEVSDGRTLRKVRLTVDVDVYYPGQSRYRAEVWNGDRWNEVARIDGADPDWRGPTRAMPDRKEAFADAVADNLAGRALAVLS